MWKLARCFLASHLLLPFPLLLGTVPSNPLPSAYSFKVINIQFALTDNPFLMPCGAAGTVLRPRCALIAHARSGECFAEPKKPFGIEHGWGGPSWFCVAICPMHCTNRDGGMHLRCVKLESGNHNFALLREWFWVVHVLLPRCSVKDLHYFLCLSISVVLHAFY